MKKLIVLLGVVGVSFGAVFSRWSTSPTLILVLYREVAVVALLLGPVLWRHREELCSVPRREFMLALAAGAVLCLQIVGYFEALRYTSIAAATVLADTDVLFIALVTVVFLHGRLSKRAWMAIAVAFGGSIVIAMGDTSSGSNAILGDGLALLAAIGSGSYMMLSSVCRRKVSALVYTFLANIGIFLTALVLSLATGTPLLGYEPLNYAAALGLALFCSLLGFGAFNWGLKFLPAAFISTAKLLEPIFSSAWGLLLFRERPGACVLIGGAIVILGVVLYIGETKELPEEEVPLAAVEKESAE